MEPVARCSRCFTNPPLPGAAVCRLCPALAAPTSLRPGSAAKMDLMADRIDAGLPPHAPGDLNLNEMGDE